jgi:hypothetical protein
MRHNLVTEPATLPKSYPPLSAYRCRAVVDWLDIRINTKKPTNFMTVQAEITRIRGTPTPVYVEAQDEGPGRAATIFDIRIHDPNRLAELNAYMKLLDYRLPFFTPPQVVKLELAVDFYSRHNLPTDLSAMTERLMTEFAATGNNPRIYVPLKDGQYTTVFLQNRHVLFKPDSRHSMYVGNRHDEQSWRIYLKRTDHNQIPITDSREHRARVEVTLSGNQLSAHCTSLQSMADIRFEGLSDKFRFRKLALPQVSVGDIQRVLDERKVQDLQKTFRKGYVALWRSKRRKFSQHSRADIELKEMVRQSLRNLTERFCAEKRWKNGDKQANYAPTGPHNPNNLTTVIPTDTHPLHPT